MHAEDDALQMGRPALLVLVRHGESLRNVVKEDNRFFLDDESRKSVQGIADWRIPLTDEGRRQALATGTILRQRFGTFEHVYHSGYQRAEQTGEGILQAFSDAERAQMRVRMSPLIRERDAGYTYDMTASEVVTAFPWLQPYWDTCGPWFGRPPGGESLADVAARTSAFLDAVFRDCAGERVLVVTHGGTLRTFRFLLERWTFAQVSDELRAYYTPNCCVTSYRCDSASGRLELDELNVVFWQ
ncbi:MAG: histidine phosphatase family protein [Vicinamibacterales bacterium]